MAATSKYHITLSDSNGEKGFITKRYSSRQKPDSLFGSRFSTGDPSYAGMNRWQRFAQSTWLGGAFQRFYEDQAMFNFSRNIDVLSHGSFKLSQTHGDAVYTGTDKIERGMKYNSAHYFAEGQYIYYSTDNFATAPTISKNFGTGKTVTDLEIYDGKLYAAVGTFGLWYHDTTDHTTWAEQLDTAATIPVNYIRAFGDNLHILYTNVIKYFDGTNVTTVKDYSSGADNNYYFKKPSVYAGRIYYPVNVTGSSVGLGQVLYYDGTNIDAIYSGYDPVGERMVVYESKLFFVVYGLEKVSIKTYDTSATRTVQSFDVAAGTTIYGDGLKYGDAAYGEGSDYYSDPMDMIIWKNFLFISIERTTNLNTLFCYDGNGWTEYMDMPVGSGISMRMWLSDRNLYLGSSEGKIYKASTTYASEGWLQGSVWDASLQEIDKMFADVTVKHEQLSAGDSIEVWYRTEKFGGFVQLGSNSTENAYSTTLEFPTGGDSIISNRFEYKIVIKSNDGTTSPVIEDVIIRYILAPNNDKKAFEYTIECTKKMRLLDGTFDTRSPVEIVDNLWSMKASNELLTLIDEDGASHTVILADTSPEVITPYSGDGTLEKYVYLKLFEL